jgi:hypothetical protein
MKICLLLMLISVIVGVSHFPNSRKAQQAASAAPQPVPANA